MQEHEDAHQPTQEQGGSRKAGRCAPAPSDDEEEVVRVQRRRTDASGTASSAATTVTQHAPQATNDEPAEKGSELPENDRLGRLPENVETSTEEGRPLSQQREKRARQEPARGYDEVKRRKTRRTPPTGGYVERGNQARAGRLKRAMQIGATTVERIVRGRYEWRDSGLQPMNGERKTIWSNTD